MKDHSMVSKSESDFIKDHSRVSKSEPGFWKNKPGYKPMLFVIAAIVFTTLVVMPPPQSMIDMVTKINPPGYKLSKGCTTIVDTVNKKLRPKAFEELKQGKTIASEKKEHSLLDARDVARLAKVMKVITWPWG